MNQFQSFVLAVTLVSLTISMGCDRSASRVAEKDQRDVGTATLEINFGEGKSPKTIDVVCSPDSTVLQMLERAQQTNELKFEVSGSGETAFVDSIDGMENKNSEGKNWIYRVNGELGDKSAGIYKVVPGDKISWSWGAPPEELK